MGVPLRSIVRVAPGPSVSEARTGDPFDVVVDGEPYGELRIYGPADLSDLKDSFVLANSGATSQEDALYWEEWEAAQATREAGRNYSVIEFRLSQNAGGRAGELGSGGGVTFTLNHRPAGVPRGERKLFRDYALASVFRSGANGPSRGGAAVRGSVGTPAESRSAPAGEGAATGGAAVSDPFMWNVIAVTPMLSDRVRFPPRLLERVGVGGRVDLRGPRTGAADPLDASARAVSPVDGPAPAPTTETPSPTLGSMSFAPSRPPAPVPETAFHGRPVPTAIAEGAWENGKPAGQGSAPDGGPPATLAGDAATAERWLYVFGLNAFSAYDETWTLYHSDPYSPSARTNGGGNRAGDAVELVGVWRLPGDGSCQLAAYPDGDAPDDAPAVVDGGGTPPFLLVDAGLPKTSDYTAYAHVSTQPLPRRRIADLGYKLARSGPAAVANGADPDSVPLVPLDVVPRLSGTADGEFLERLHVTWDGAASVWRWSIPDPVRTTARLAALASDELERRRVWRKSVSAAALHSGLVAATVYEPTHGRDHLEDELADRTPTSAPVAWASFSPAPTDPCPPGAEGPRVIHGDPELRHFQYGFGRQDAYLRHRVDVAGSRMAAWLASETFGEYLRDLGLAREADAADEGVERAVLEALELGCAAGPGAGVLLSWLDKAGVLGRLPRPDDGTTDLAEVVEPQPAPGSAFDVLTSPAFYLVWRMTSKGGRAAAALQKAAGPALVLATKARATDGFGARVLGALLAERAVNYPVTGPARGGVVGRFRVDRVDLRLDGTPYTWRGRGTPGGPPRQSWRLALQVDVPAGALGAAAQVAGGLDFALRLADLARRSEDGEYGLEDGVALMRTLASGASFARSTGVGARVAGALPARAASPVLSVGRFFVRGAATFEVAAAAFPIYAAVTARADDGQQSFGDVDEAALLGTAVGVAGSLMMTGGAATAASGASTVGAGVAAAAASPAVLGGLALVAIGAGVSWWGRYQRAREAAERDPLVQQAWLQTTDVWGARTAAGPREALLGLVLPGWTPEGPLGRYDLDREGPEPVMGRAIMGDDGLTARFVRRAYAFPVSAERRFLIPPVPALPSTFSDPARRRLEEIGASRTPVAPAVHGLVLDIDPWYVADRGTFLVNANVQNTATNQRAPVTCAVHYVRSGLGFYYRVMNEGEALGLGEMSDLAAVAEEQGWAWSPEATAARSSFEGGATSPTTHRVLRVHVGAGWRRRTSSPTARTAAQAALAEASSVLASSWPDPARRQAARRASAAARAVLAEDGVDARSVLAGPATLAAALAGPCRVAGSALFCPAAPFRPAADEPGPGDLVARESVGGRPATRPARVGAAALAAFVDADGEPASIYVAVEAITPGIPEDPR